MHQGIIKLRAASSVQDDDGKAAFGSFVNGAPGQLGGRDAWLKVNRDIDTLAQGFQLLDGSRAVRVGSHQHDTLALRAQHAGQFAGGGGLARTLQANQHQHIGMLAGQVEALGHSQGGDQLFVDDFNDLLRRIQGFRDFQPNRAFAHPGNEVFDHGVVDIGFQQRQAHLAHCHINIRRREFAPAAQLRENIVQAFGQVLKHGIEF